MSKELTVPTYKSTEIAEFGNKLLSTIVMQAVAESDAQDALSQANEVKKFIGVEMIRAIFDAHEKDENLNVMAVWGSPKEVRNLNTRILVAFGVMEQVIDGDTVVKKWTDPQIEKLYAISEDLKEKDEKEYNKRSANWRKLTLQMTTACKTVCRLIENKNKPDDLYYGEDENTGEQVAKLRNAPPEIKGEEKGDVVLGLRKPRKGAKLSPTLASLTKSATERFSTPKGDTKKDDRKEGAEMGMTDEKFGGIVNTTIRAIQSQESKFTADMIKQLKSLQTHVEKAVKQGANKSS